MQVVWLIGVLWLLVCAGCSSSSKKPQLVPAPRPATLPASCLLEQPPEDPPRLDRLGAADLADRDAGCPAPFELCVTTAGAAELEQVLLDARRWQRRARRWMVEAWLRCGPPVTPAPNHPP